MAFSVKDSEIFFLKSSDVKRKVPKSYRAGVELKPRQKQKLEHQKNRENHQTQGPQHQQVPQMKTAQMG